MALENEEHTAYQSGLFSQDWVCNPGVIRLAVAAERLLLQCMYVPCAMILSVISPDGDFKKRLARDKRGGVALSPSWSIRG